MGFDINEPEQRRKLKTAIEAADITVGDLWLYYFSIGGSVGEYEVEAYLQGMISIPGLERDLLAMAVNDQLLEGKSPRAPYADELPQEDPPTAENP